MKRIILLSLVFSISFFSQKTLQAQAQLTLETVSGLFNNTYHGNTVHFNTADNLHNFNWFYNPDPANPSLSLNYQTFDGYDIVFLHQLLYVDGDDEFFAIGHSNPAAVFHIDGRYEPQLVVGDGAGSLAYCTINQPTEAASNTSGILRIRDDGSTQVQVNEAAHAYQLLVYGDGQISGMWNPSDQQLKHQIQKIPSALNQVLKLNPAQYYYKTNEKAYEFLNLPTEKQFGLLAQEIETVFPNLTRQTTQYDEEGEAIGALYTVNYMGLIPVLIAAMQEQDANINEKTSKIANLEQEMKALNAKMERLEVLIEKLEK